jgi:hypothetical protein
VEGGQTGSIEAFEPEADRLFMQVQVLSDGGNACALGRVLDDTGAFNGSCGRSP